MVEKEPGLLHTIMLYGGLVITWVGGEAGRVLVAGGFGGIFRWFMLNKRSLRDGGVAVVTGMISAKYLSPLVLVLIERFFGDLGDGADVVATTAFAAGVGGMSVAKVAIAIIESRAAKEE